MADTNQLGSYFSKKSAHTYDVASLRVRHSIGATHIRNDEELLNAIGYKQELRRHYSTIQVFGIAFSIMGLLPSISSTMNVGLESGPAGLIWGWFCAGFFVLMIGLSMTFLGSSIPTSGGLYYWTSYYAADSVSVPLSFMIAVANTLGLCGGLCSITYGFASEVLSAVVVASDGDFNITDGKLYGVFVGCIATSIVICCLSTKNTAILQSVSICVNVFLVLLFCIAVPIGVRNSDTMAFNSAQYVFNNWENSRNWTTGWSFMLSWMPCIWTIGAFDSVIHCSEEAKDAQRAIPFGIIGSIVACWVLGFMVLVVASFCIKDGDVAALLASNTGSAMAQIIFDALGKRWTIACMSLIAFGQYLMGCSLLIAASRQVWAFARDDGLPIIYNFVKVINPRIPVPLRATVLVGLICIVIGLMILIGPAGSGALFSLAVLSNALAWAMPVFLVLLPTGSARFVPGPFYWGKPIVTVINIIVVAWVSFLLFMASFPDSKNPNAQEMNYNCVLNPGVWILSLIYYYVYGYKVFLGPKSNLDENVIEGLDVESAPSIDENGKLVKIDKVV